MPMTDRTATRAALRGMYLQALVATAGLENYGPVDDANLDLLDRVVDGLYGRKSSGDQVVAGLKSTPAADPVLPQVEEVHPAFRTVDPEPAEDATA